MITAAAVALLALAPPPATGTTVGKIAPNFSLTDQHGDKVKLHDFCGKVVLLDFGTFW